MKKFEKIEKNGKKFFSSFVPNHSIRENKVKKVDFDEKKIFSGQILTLSHFWGRKSIFGFFCRYFFLKKNCRSKSLNWRIYSDKSQEKNFQSSDFTKSRFLGFFGSEKIRKNQFLTFFSKKFFLNFFFVPNHSIRENKVDFDEKKLVVRFWHWFASDFRKK